MTIYEFLDDLIAGKPLGQTTFEKGENPADLFVVASKMLPCSARSLALALCYAKGYGTKKNIAQFEEELLSSLKYQDYRTYLCLIRAYTTGLHLGDETILIPGKEEQAKELIERSNPLVANYYNTQHRYKTIQQLKDKEKEEEEKRRKQEEKLHLISKTKSEIVQGFNQLNDEELIEKISFVSHQAFNPEEFLAETLTYALKKKKSEKIIQFIYDELIRLSGGIQDEENLKYFPVIQLMDAGYFEHALQMLELSEDPDCLLNGDGWIFLQEGICLYHLGKYQKALAKLEHAAALGDYEEYVYEYVKKCEKAIDEQ